MCDQDSLNDMTEHLRATGSDISRRRFGLLTAGAMIATLPRAANALDVKEQDVEVKTKDGTADSYFVAPSTSCSLTSSSNAARSCASAPSIPLLFGIS